MLDHDRECYNCGRYLTIDEGYAEERNDYGFPVPICSDCGTPELVPDFGY